MSKKIKILFAIDCMNIGGAPSVVFDHLRKINKNKFDPYLLMLYPSKRFNFLNKIDFIDKNKIIQFKLKNRSIFDLKTIFKIYLFIRKEKFSILYSHLFLSNLLVRSCAILAGVKKIFIFEHSTYYNKSRLSIIADRLLSYKTKKIFVSVKTVLEFTAKQENILKNKFEIIPNPINLPQIDNHYIEEIKKKYGLKNKKIVLSVGRFSGEKGQKYLIEAARILKKNNPELRFLIVGHGPKEKELLALIEKYKLSDYCYLIVEPENAKQFYYFSDLFVLTSTREGQSMVIYEAMLAGVPVISSDLDTLTEIIDDHSNGVFFASTDFADLAKKIEALIYNKSKKLSYSEKSKVKINNYKTKATIKKLENIFLE